MAVYHEVKEITQLEEAIVSFQLAPYLDDAFRAQPLNLFPVSVSAGTSPYAPTFRWTVKSKGNDTDPFALFQKTVPPYPAISRFGVYNGGPQRSVSGGILMVDGMPYWWWNPWSWPPGYAFDPLNPPATWLANPSFPVEGAGFNSWQGEVAFSLGRYDSWFPPGNYHGEIETWRTGNGTPPAAPAEMILQCTLRINKTLRRSPFFS